ncbi:hypothetical protein [Streptomyces sannanensis]
MRIKSITRPHLQAAARQATSGSARPLGLPAAPAPVTIRRAQFEQIRKYFPE